MTESAPCGSDGCCPECGGRGYTVEVGRSTRCATCDGTCHDCYPPDPT